MPNQTIDLWNGLEAWYDLDPRYYDDQRGVLADKSGHGQVADANGSPTVGVEGPDSFEATNFSGDGSGDYFELNSGYLTSDKITLIALVRISDFDVRNTLTTSEDETGNFEPEFRQGDKLNLYLDAYNTHVEVTGFSENKWHWAFMMYDDTEGTATAIRDDYADYSSLSASTPTFEPQYISAPPGVNGDQFNGDIAVFGVYNRIITQSEVEYLNNLTAPPRSL